MTVAVNARMDRIREIVAEHLELDASDLDDNGNFLEDYGADSLGLMDVLAALEREFGIEIDQAQFERLVDLASTYRVVAESAGW